MSHGEGPGPAPLRLVRAAWVLPALGGRLLHPVMWDQFIVVLEPCSPDLWRGYCQERGAGPARHTGWHKGARKLHHCWEVPALDGQVATRAGGGLPGQWCPTGVWVGQFWAGCHAELSQEVLIRRGGTAGWWTPLQADPRGRCLAPARLLHPRLRLPIRAPPEITSLILHFKEFPVQPQRQLDISAAGRPEENQCVYLPTQTWAEVPGPGTPALSLASLERR